MAENVEQPSEGTGMEAVEPLDGLLCFAIYSTGFAFNRVYKPLLEKLGLTYPQYLVVALLQNHEDRTVGELGDQLFLESSTLTPLVKRLETGGIVTRRRDGTDERVVRVSLTEKGRGIAQEAACLPEQILEATGLSADELQAMQQRLSALRSTLRAAGQG